MIISHKHKFIYIKTPKTAGTSTELFLEQFCDQGDIITPIWPRESNWNHRPRNHANFSSHIKPISIKNKIGKDIFDLYYKFCNVRNPWDRLVSNFFWFKKFNRHITFDKYCELSGHISMERYYQINNTPIINGYIKYENLVEDTIHILNQIGIKISNIEQFPKSKIMRKSKEYRSFFNRKQIDIVATACKDEIDRFGYSW